MNEWNAKKNVKWKNKSKSKQTEIKSKNNSNKKCTSASRLCAALFCNTPKTKTIITHVLSSISLTSIETHLLPAIWEDLDIFKTHGILRLMIIYTPNYQMKESTFSFHHAIFHCFTISSRWRGNMHKM